MLINEQIRDKEVRLVDTDGSQLGILPVKEAQKIAYDKNLDLVKIAPQAKPPVCKIMDYGKYRFEMTKKDKEAKKNQKVVNIKEVRLSPSIDEHDFITKLNHAKKFLSAGDKVKASVRFRGREMRHTDLGENVLKRFAEAVAEVGNVEKIPKLDGRHMIMFISPKQ
jgi:translation initiation factor IF-3